MVLLLALFIDLSANPRGVELVMVGGARLAFVECILAKAGEQFPCLATICAKRGAKYPQRRRISRASFGSTVTRC
ncbi:MAG: hypothetical protein JO218_12940 [Burkholderiales bacterium]|nr:hypothetical protein [Burkholderiales bacterium]